MRDLALLTQQIATARPLHIHARMEQNPFMLAQ